MPLGASDVLSRLMCWRRGGATYQHATTLAERLDYQLAMIGSSADRRDAHNGAEPVEYSTH